jgi:hypothetical protein
MDKKIETFTEFRSRLVGATERLETLMKRDPDPAYASILKQLQHVAEWTSKGFRPREEDMNRLSFGMLASRNLDDTDQPLARELYILADMLFHWPSAGTEWK